MAHQRKLIRQAVASRLIAANTAAGSRVTRTKVEPHPEAQLPALSVYSLSESVDPSSTGTPRELMRTVKIEIAGWVSHRETLPVDDAMDDLAEQIESAMDADPWLGETVASSVLESTVMQVLEENGRSDPLIGVVVLTYAMTYYTTIPTPTTGVGDFVTVDAAHRLEDGVLDTVSAKNQFTVQEPT